MDLTRLPLRVRPALDEAPHSLLDRLAIRHECNSVADFLAIIPSEIAASLSTLVRSSDPNIIIQQSSLLQLSGAEHLTEFTATRVSGLQNADSAAQSGKYKAFSVRSKICSLCIKQDLNNASEPENLRPFRRAWWDLFSVHTCPIHKVYLIAKCQNCEQKLDKNLITPRYCTCGFDLIHSKATHVNDMDTEADNYLRLRLCSNTRTQDKLLDQMPLRIAAVCMAHVGRLAMPYIDPSSGILPSSPSYIKISSAGYRILAGGAEALATFLDKNIPVDNDDRYLSVASRYGSLYRWLSLAKDGSLDQVRDVIIRHAAENFPRSGRKELFGITQEIKPQITFGTAVKNGE